MDIGLSRDELTRALYRTLAANGMTDHAHIRLMVTRGVKRTPYQDPRMTIGPATIVIIPEYKNPKPETLSAASACSPCTCAAAAPDVQDPKLNSHSKLNCITACIQATKAGADEALMLDPHGFVATCNSTHFFIVRKGEVWTSTGMYCLGGITRANVLRVCRDNGIPAFEKSFSLTDVYGADEAFVTGTFAGVAPVVEIDGRSISAGRGPMVERLQNLYRELIARDVAARAIAGLTADASRARAHRHVVRPAQYLDRDDARVREPRRLRRRRRAVLCALPRADRTRSSGPRRSHRRRRDRLAPRRRAC